MDEGTPDMDEPDVVIGKRVIEAREAAGLTQRELAKRLGVSLWTMERLERGELDLTPHLAALQQHTSKPAPFFETRQPMGAGAAEPRAATRPVRAPGVKAPAPVVRAESREPAPAPVTQPPGDESRKSQRIVARIEEARERTEKAVRAADASLDTAGHLVADLQDAERRLEARRAQEESLKLELEEAEQRLAQKEAERRRAFETAGDLLRKLEARAEEAEEQAERAERLSDLRGRYGRHEQDFEELLDKISAAEQRTQAAEDRLESALEWLPKPDA